MNGVRTLKTVDSYLEQRALKEFSGYGVCSTAYRFYDRGDFTFLPERYKSCKRFVTGALYDQKGSIIDYSVRHGGLVVGSINPPKLIRPFSLELEKAPLVTGKSLFLGSWMGHYGHFITEFFSKLWCRKELDKYDRVFVTPFVFGSMRSIKKLNFHKVLLESLGVDLNRLELLVDPVVFEDVAVPEQGWLVNGTVNSHLASLYSSSRDFFHGRAGMPEKIFLTRMPHSSYQRLRNLDAINQVFSRNGFKVLYPELMDVEAQMEYYTSCKVMAALSGTLAHNCLFTQPGSLVIEVGDLRTRRQLLPIQVAAAQLAEAEYAHIDYKGTSDGVLDVLNLGKVLQGLDVI